MTRFIFKRIICLILIAFVFVCICGCDILDGCKDYDEVSDYVNDNYEILTEFINNFEDYKGGSLHECFGRRTIIENVYLTYYDKGIIQFYCGGRGLATNAIYTGFYFSSTNEPFGFGFNDSDLTEIEKDVFYWENSNATETFRTQRIRDNWFYYYMQWY